jgi:peptidylprolyl isomerase
MLPMVTHRAYLDIEMDGKALGRIVVGLFGDVAPKAVENFVALCKCDRGKGKLTGKDLCYKNSKIHRVVPNFMLQGGDFTHGDGTGGETIFDGGLDFEDESFQVKHNRAYMLSMANSGRKNSNRSQWFINTVKTQWLDGKNEIFGMVLEGLTVITDIEKVGTHGGVPKAEIVIKDSGTLALTVEDAKPRLLSDRLKM